MCSSFSSCSSCLRHPSTRIIVGCAVIIGVILGYFYFLNMALDALPQVKDYDFWDVLIIFSFVVFPMIFVYVFYKACKYWNNCAEDDVQYLPVYVPYNARIEDR